MFIRASDLWGFAIGAADGGVGRVHDLQVDDQRWAVRDIVVDVGHWLTGRMALIDPSVVVRADRARRTLQVALTAEQIAEAPGIDSHPAVARQRRVEPYNYLGIPACWGGGPEGRSPALVAEEAWPSTTAQIRRIDPHLRSLQELSHYRLEASDGEAGRVKDWLVDDRSWMTQYAVVRPGSAWAGKDVLVPVRWLGPVSYSARVVHAGLDRGTVIHAPDFDAAVLPEADYETRLLGWYDHPDRRARTAVTR